VRTSMHKKNMGLKSEKRIGHDISMLICNKKPKTWKHKTQLLCPHNWGVTWLKCKTSKQKNNSLWEAKSQSRKVCKLFIKWKKIVHIFKLPYIKTFVFHSHALVEFSNISWFLGLIKIIWHEYICFGTKR